MVLKLLETAFIAQIEKPRSSLGFKYPTLRDHPLHTPEIWLEGKRADDAAEDLWRIHDDLYDFTNFVDSHPGGSDWLSLTKGTDITEAFECHHMSSLPEDMLSTYFVRKASGRRNSPFTFKEDGFYKTLKRLAKKQLQNVPRGAADRSKILADCLFVGFLSTALFATSWQSYVFAIISAILLTMSSVAAHNFFHQKDNFRMYYFDFNLMSSRGWRISHALSHHIYTNTVYDLEISSIEPFLQYLPNKKNFFTRYVSWFYSSIFHTFIYLGYYIRLIIQAVVNKKGLRKENYLPWLLLLILLGLSGQSFLNVTRFFFLIQLLSSFIFGVVGVNAGHHHPDVFHDGDAARPTDQLDWGMYQVDAVMDRTDITGSHFLVLISFGDHVLHHLFPALDHGTLEYLYPVFKKTCEDFGVEYKTGSQWECVKGQFRQLAKIEPKREPPIDKLISTNL